MGSSSSTPFFYSSPCKPIFQVYLGVAKWFSSLVNTSTDVLDTSLKPCLIVVQMKPNETTKPDLQTTYTRSFLCMLPQDSSKVTRIKSVCQDQPHHQLNQEPVQVGVLYNLFQLSLSNRPGKETCKPPMWKGSSTNNVMGWDWTSHTLEPELGRQPDEALGVEAQQPDCWWVSHETLNSRTRT